MNPPASHHADRPSRVWSCRVGDVRLRTRLASHPLGNISQVTDTPPRWGLFSRSRYSRTVPHHHLTKWFPSSPHSIPLPIIHRESPCFWCVTIYGSVLVVFVNSAPRRRPHHITHTARHFHSLEVFFLGEQCRPRGRPLSAYTPFGSNQE